MEERTEQSGLAPEWHIPAGEAGKENPRRFKRKPLDGMEALDLAPEMSFESGRLRLSGKGLRIAVRLGVVDWENVPDENGQPAKFDIDRIGELVDMPTLYELGMKIAADAVFSDNDAVKSSSQSKSA